MEAIILVDRNGEKLLPLTDNTCVALLPVAGKSVIEHTLEALVDAGIRQAHIVVSAYAVEFKEQIGQGERWGISLTYSTSRGEESPEKILKTLPNPITAPFIALRGDVVRSADMLKEFLAQAENSDALYSNAVCENGLGLMVYCKQTQTDACQSLAWSAVAHPVNELHLTGRVSLLDSLASFHQANLDAVSGRLALRLPGRVSSLGLTEGRRSKIYPQNIRQGVALVGSNCSTYPSVQFSGEVVIGDNVIIDRCATIENSVILPNTYVGELVELRNAIVRGNDLIRVDLGSALKVRDAFLLADLNTMPLHKGLGSIYNRLAGGLLLLLSLPLWLIAGIQLLMQKSDSPIIMHALRGNKILLDQFGMPQRAEFICSEFDVKSPVLRYLPRLLAVISGDLRLVGALPVSLQTATERQSEWERQADQAPAGLIGLTQLTLPANATAEEKLLSDSFYWANFSVKQDFQYMMLGIKTLFSSKAWS